MSVSLSDRIQEILLRDWDPLGAARDPAARDSYDVYIPQLAALVRREAGVDLLCANLWRIETVLLELPGDWVRARQTAERIALLKDDDGD